MIFDFFKNDKNTPPVRENNLHFIKMVFKDLVYLSQKELCGENKHDL